MNRLNHIVNVVDHRLLLLLAVALAVTAFCGLIIWAFGRKTRPTTHTVLRSERTARQVLVTMEEARTISGWANPDIINALDESFRGLFFQHPAPNAKHVCMTLLFQDRTQSLEALPATSPMHLLEEIETCFAGRGWNVRPGYNSVAVYRPNVPFTAATSIAA
jgi:hypothetical protein